MTIITITVARSRPCISNLDVITSPRRLLSLRADMLSDRTRLAISSDNRTCAINIPTAVDSGQRRVDLPHALRNPPHRQGPVCNLPIATRPSARDPFAVNCPTNRDTSQRAELDGTCPKPFIPAWTPARRWPKIQYSGRIPLHHQGVGPVPADSAL